MNVIRRRNNNKEMYGEKYDGQLYLFIKDYFTAGCQNPTCTPEIAIRQILRTLMLKTKYGDKAVEVKDGNDKMKDNNGIKEKFDFGTRHIVSN